MSNSKIGWCEASCAQNQMYKTTKTIIKGRKKYKYNKMEMKDQSKDYGDVHVGKQVKRDYLLDISRNKSFKEHTNTSVRAHERALEHEALFALDTDEIDFIEKDKRFSDYYHFD